MYLKLTLNAFLEGEDDPLMLHENFFDYDQNTSTITFVFEGCFDQHMMTISDILEYWPDCQFTLTYSPDL